jgi:hypothetical protein
MDRDTLRDQTGRRSHPRPFDVAVMHACAGPPGGQVPVPAGHQLTRVRLRCLLRSERLVVRSGTVCLGVAAYQVVESDVRVVHELLVDHRLDPDDTAAVVDALLGAVEFAARADRVRGLTILTRSSLPLELFRHRGYAPLLADAAGAWLQKKIQPGDWLIPGSSRVQ